MPEPGRLQASVDVAVIGGGLAGLAAAVAAARRGARVALIEQEGFLGGAAAALRHRHLCGLYANAPETPRGVLNPGLTEEALARLAPGAAPVRQGRVWLLPCAADLAGACAAWLAGEKRIRVLARTRVLDSRMRGGRVESLRLRSRGGISRLAAGVFLAAGAAGWLPETAPPPGSRPLAGYALELAGITWDPMLAIRAPYALRLAAEAGRLPRIAAWTQIAPPDARGRCQLKLSVLAGTPVEETWARAREIVAVLRRDLPELRRATVAWRAGRPWERGGDGVRGRYRLKTRDVLAGRRFADAAFCGAWPSEAWDARRGPVFRYPLAETYDVPARSLRAAGVANVFLAGRGVAAEPGAQASVRAGGLCLASGEAAGSAAAAFLSTETA